MKTLTAADVQPSGEVLAAMNLIQAAMAGRRDLAAARQRLEPDRAEKQRRVEQLAKHRADLLVERAMQVNPAMVERYNQRLDAIDAEQVAATRDLEAIDAAQQALQNRINDADARLFEMSQSSIVYTLHGHHSMVREVLQRRLEEIVERHLLPFAIEVAAMNAATNAFRDWEKEFLVPNMIATSTLLSGVRSYVGGTHALLSAEWEKHPELVAASEAAAAPRLLLAQLRTAGSRIGERIGKHAGPSEAWTWG